jgi:hypothetical protein
MLTHNVVSETWHILLTEGIIVCSGQPRPGYKGLVVDKMAREAGLLRVIQFPLALIPPTALRSSSSIIRGWYIKPKRGQRAKWTQSHPQPKKKCYFMRQNAT